MKKSLSQKTKKWIQLLAGFAFIWAFILLSPLVVEKFPAIDKKLKLIREKNINANALFYTETPQTTEAGMKMNHR